MEVLDTTIVNVSLPHIAGSLSVSSDEATWTLTTYLVANGGRADNFRGAQPAAGSKTLFPDLHRRLHAGVVRLRHGDGILADPAIPRRPGAFRRRATADPAGDHPRPFSAREATGSFFDIGGRHHHRADSGAGAGRLPDRHLFLELDIPDQCAGRRADLLRRDAFCRGSAPRTERTQDGATLRLYRSRFCRAGARLHGGRGRSRRGL